MQAAQASRAVAARHESVCCALTSPERKAMVKRRGGEESWHDKGMAKIGRQLSANTSAPREPQRHAHVAPEHSCGPRSTSVTV
jgi:hypothetical protein